MGVVTLDAHHDVRVLDDFSTGRRENLERVTAWCAAGGGEFLLFSLPLTADNAGTATFLADAADNLPDNDSFVFGREVPVLVDSIQFHGVSLTITPSPAPAGPSPDRESDSAFAQAADRAHAEEENWLVPA